jgi:methyl-accepting chemotaxis protein
LEKLDKMTELQDEIVAFRTNIMQGRVELRTVFTSYDGCDDELELAHQYLSAATKNLQNGIRISMQHLDSIYVQEMNAAITQIGQLNVLIDAIHESQLAYRADLVNVESNAALVAEQITSSAGIVEVDTLSDLTTPNTIRMRMNNLTRLIKFSNTVTTIREMSLNLIYNIDNSQLEETIDECEDALDILTAIDSSSTNQTVKDAMQTATTATNDYITSLRNMSDQINLQAESVATARVALSAVVDSATSITSEIGETVADNLAKDIETSTSVMLLLIAVVVLSVIVSIIMALVINKQITGPLQAMVGWLKQAGETGNIDFSDAEWALCDKLAEGKDEIGQSIKAFSVFMRHVVYYGGLLSHVAGHDLTVKVEKLSDHDTIGMALESMIEQMSDIFGEIKIASNQVATGSGQVSDAAQLLAQGSTKQAAAIKELSDSVADVAVKTEGNAHLADDAAALSEKIRHNAEKGTKQMDAMMQAVREIYDASHEIKNVISTIDSIAFQTNILALNAAVEAARAGNAGRGFAVVADEVRNLAAKSAEAAKETGVLIENSVAKSELGARIAEETAASLTEIVSGINSSTEIISRIAVSSDEQAEDIKQITDDIDQVATVVQQNSATAEQSAAASEEMSSQSGMLNRLISRFQLSEDSQLSSQYSMLEPLWEEPPTYEELPTPEETPTPTENDVNSFALSNDSSKY